MGHLLDTCLQILWRNQQYSIPTSLVDMVDEILWMHNAHYQYIRQQRAGDLQWDLRQMVKLCLMVFFLNHLIFQCSYGRRLRLLVWQRCQPILYLLISLKRI